jgi:hypothetical protein
MNNLLKAVSAVQDKVEFLRRCGPSSNHMSVSVVGLAGERGISSESVSKALEIFADRGILSMTTWRNEVRREVNWYEWRDENFFYNPHNSNCVRLRLAQSDKQRKGTIHCTRSRQPDLGVCRRALRALGNRHRGF